MGQDKNKCSGCYWSEQCAGSTPCEDYTPLSDEPDVEFYDAVIRENFEEYQRVVDEMNS